MPLQILLVDSDPKWCAHFRRTVAGLLCEVHTVSSADEARLALSHTRYQLILVANRLGRLPGLLFVEELRAHPDNVAVIYLSSFADTDERVSALRSGADEVIERSMRPDELRYRVSRRLARAQASVLEWRVGRGVIRALRPGITVDGTLHRMTSTEHRMLVMLVVAAGAAVPREMLLEAIRLSPDDPPGDRTLDGHICRLRARVAIAGIVIETIKTVGYALRVTASTAAVA